MKSPVAINSVGYVGTLFWCSKSSARAWTSSANHGRVGSKQVNKTSLVNKNSSLLRNWFFLCVTETWVLIAHWYVEDVFVCMIQLFIRKNEKNQAESRTNYSLACAVDFFPICMSRPSFTQLLLLWVMSHTQAEDLQANNWAPLLRLCSPFLWRSVMSSQGWGEARILLQWSLKFFCKSKT